MPENVTNANLIVHGLYEHDTAEISCHEGYATEDGKKVNITCLDNGTWSMAPPCLGKQMSTYIHIWFFAQYLSIIPLSCVYNCESCICLLCIRL